GVAPQSTPVETVGMALGDGQLYINQLRETNPTTARLAEIAISGALGGGVKSLIMIPVSQGLDAVVNEVAGEHIQNATDYVTNHVGKVITRDDESYDEFAELAAGGTYEDRQGRIKAGSEFILSTVLGVISTGKGGESGAAVGVNGSKNSGQTSKCCAWNDSNNSTNIPANSGPENNVNAHTSGNNTPLSNTKFANQAEANEALKQYEIAKNTDSEIVLGRLQDTEAGSQLGMTRLNSDNWSPNVNDAFVQGGIDAGKPFYLGSSPDISNYRAAWNALEGNRGSHPQTVFFREMKQLRDAGYRLEGDYMLPPK